MINMPRNQLGSKPSQRQHTTCILLPKVRCTSTYVRSTCSLLRRIRSCALPSVPSGGFRHSAVHDRLHGLIDFFCCSKARCRNLFRDKRFCLFVTDSTFLMTESVVTPRSNKTLVWAASWNHEMDECGALLKRRWLSKAFTNGLFCRNRKTQETHWGKQNFAFPINTKLFSPSQSFRSSWKSRLEPRWRRWS